MLLFRSQLVQCVVCSYSFLQLVQILLTGPLAAGQQEARKPAWWSDPKVDAIHAYNIINKRFKLHGPQRESVTRSTLVSS